MAGKWAGLRTHMLVCLSALMFVKVGEALVANVARSDLGNTLQTDPVRMIEAIMSGIAFLGAGVIFRDPERNVARGLTTAASLLTVAPIGIAVAVERYVLAVGTTLLVLFVLRVVHWFEMFRTKPPV
jgi:putative Mg2+ transporter-C (MgtC) family protein